MTLMATANVIKTIKRIMCFPKFCERVSAIARVMPNRKLGTKSYLINS